jgi:hypothetical protein
LHGLSVGQDDAIWITYAEDSDGEIPEGDSFGGALVIAKLAP